MKKTLLYILTFGVSLSSAIQANAVPLNKSAYPEFSWDTLPVGVHFSKRGDFTPEQAEFLSRYPLICLEKHQGMFSQKDARKGAAVAAAAIKKYNPKVKVLFYWNSNIDSGKNYFGHQILADDQHPEWKLTGSKDVLIRGHQATYDTSNPDLRKWWVDIAVNAVKDGKLDGAFIDALPHTYRDEKQNSKNLGEEKLEAVRAGTKIMIDDLAKKLGKDKIIVFNNINPNGRDFEARYVDASNGGMIENFCNYTQKGTNGESCAKQIAQLQIAAKQKRIMMVKCWPRYSYRREEEFQKVSKDEMMANIREDIVFPLACFLAGAGEYAYFLYSWGYGEKFGSLIDFDEYHKPLGKPKGDAVRKGWEYTRKFEYADVWVNVETKEAKIDWKPKKK